MNELTETPIFRVDFNSVDPDSWLVIGAISDANVSIRPDVGSVALLVDDEGLWCYGVVQLIEGGGDLVHFELDQDTWARGELLNADSVPPTPVSFHVDELVPA